MLPPPSRWADALQTSSGSNATSAMNTAGVQSNSFILTATEVVVAIVAIVVLGTLVTRLVGSVARRAGASKSVVNSVRQWVAVLMVVSGLAAAASLTGVSSEFTTLTFSGIAGLAVSLALQSTLSNIIAGLLMLQDGVIRLGDEIEFGSVKGEVVKLSLRTTWVKTPDGVIAVIGNSNLASGPIKNYTARARLEKKLQV
jgi:small conductance mechanosensitive channel